MSGVLKAKVGGVWVPIVGSGMSAEVARWYSAWGIIAKGTFTSAGQISLPANIPTVVTTPLAVATVTGRRYRITFVARAWDLSGIATSTFARVILRVNGTPQPTGDPLKGGIAGLYDLINFHWLVDGDGTSKTFDATITPNQVSAVYGEPNTSTFYVEDVGPVAGATVPPPQVTITPWANVTFTNGWTNFGGGYQSCQYRLFGDVVSLRGLMAAGTAAQSAFTLPVGFRPPARLQIVTQAGGAFGWFSIDSGGQVNPEQGANAAYNINCSFSITP